MCYLHSNWSVVILLHLFVHPVGVPSQGGDFVPPASDVFIFNSGDSRSCLEAIIFNDDVYEITEDFTASFRGFRLEDLSEVPSITGVTVQPSTTRVLIVDTDGELMHS